MKINITGNQKLLTRNLPSLLRNHCALATVCWRLLSLKVKTFAFSLPRLTLLLLLLERANVRINKSSRGCQPHPPAHMRQEKKVITKLTESDS